MRPAVGEHLGDVVADAGAGVEAGRQGLGEADADVDRRELADPRQRPQQLQRAQRQRRRLREEAEVVGLQHLVEVEVLELGGDARVEHLHHLVGGDAVGEHPGDEGAGAGADVDVEVVDRAVDGEQVERAQRADLVDAAGEAAAAEDQSRLRGLFAAARFAARFGLDVDDFAHQEHGVSQADRPARPLPCAPTVLRRDDETRLDPARGGLPRPSSLLAGQRSGQRGLRPDAEPG